MDAPSPDATEVADSAPNLARLVTIQHIALALGIHKSTVSNALSGKGRILFPANKFAAKKSKTCLRRLRT